MKYKILSGTDIHEDGEQYNSASQALEAVTSPLARKLPNIRVFDENGHQLRHYVATSTTSIFAVENMSSTIIMGDPPALPGWQ